MIGVVTLRMLLGILLWGLGKRGIDLGHRRDRRSWSMTLLQHEVGYGIF
jgi:hypothetical protein